ncbi:hypothetical protein RIF29_01987 [Crotalaria pallida]|uniref:Uncharacterized protein n=1 Tax=Crotalaria pallida TaxID=3830 RepID=A0AAN9IYN6_CROPI
MKLRANTRAFVGDSACSPKATTSTVSGLVTPTVEVVDSGNKEVFQNPDLGKLAGLLWMKENFSKEDLIARVTEEKCKKKSKPVEAKQQGQNETTYPSEYYDLGTVKKSLEEKAEKEAEWRIVGRGGKYLPMKDQGRSSSEVASATNAIQTRAEGELILVDKGKAVVTDTTGPSSQRKHDNG